jgi:cyclophilin family peptidyl-prolyl cis-trans isomerase
MYREPVNQAVAMPVRAIPYYESRDNNAMVAPSEKPRRGFSGMRKILLTLALALVGGAAMAADKVSAHPHILIETTMGNIKLELEGKLAPITVGHFLERVDNGFYDGLIFHRVIPGFMAQAGGYTPGLELREDDASIPNESGNGMSNVRGTIAMARTNDPHSANTQFFINVADNVRLDPGNNRWGYAVFGYVIEGMEVVDEIVSVRTGAQGKLRSDVPMVPIVIKKISRVTYD